MIGRLFYLMIFSILFTVDGLGQRHSIFFETGYIDCGGFNYTGLVYDGYYKPMQNKGADDLYIMKIDTLNEDSNWKVSYGGSNDDCGVSMINSIDGGFVVIGYTSSNDGDFKGMNQGLDDVLVIKVDSDGDLVWKRVFGGNQNDRGRSIIAANDGGFLITGYSESNDGDFKGMNKGHGDIFVMKLDEDGKTVWIKSYGGNDTDDVDDIKKVGTDYIITGSTQSNDGDFSGMNIGNSDIFVMKLDSNDDIVWKKNFGGTGYDRVNDVVISINEEVILVGETNSNDGDFNQMNNGDSDLFLLKLTSDGSIVWKDTFGGSSMDDGQYIDVTTEGGYIIRGTSFSTDKDLYLFNKGPYLFTFSLELDKYCNPVLLGKW